MTLAIAAISVSEQIEKYGAYAGLAAIVGLGVLSLLYSRRRARSSDCARAGRAPERAAELEAAWRPTPRAAPRSRHCARRPPPDRPRPGLARGRDATRPRPPARRRPRPPSRLRPEARRQTQSRRPVAGTGAGAPTPVPAATASAPAAGAAPTQTPSPPAETVSPGATNGAPTTPPKTPPPSEPVVGPRVPGRPPPTGPTPSASPSPSPPALLPAPAPARALRGGPPSRSVPLVEEPAGHRRPSGRVLGVLGGSLLVVAAVVGVLVLTLGGDDAPPPPNQVAETVADTTAAEPGRTQSSRQARIDRADTPVLVLNGTGVDGLARQVADRLGSTGYNAAVDNAQARDATLIAYKDGAEAAAREIGRLLEVPSAQIQPMPQELTAQAGTNAVVVVMGGDKASG